MNVAQNAPVIPKNRDFQSSWDSSKTSAWKNKEYNIQKKDTKGRGFMNGFLRIWSGCVDFTIVYL